MNHAQALGHARDRRPGREPHLDRPPLVPVRAQRTRSRRSATGTSGPTSARRPRPGHRLPGVQKTTWTCDEQAGKYYFHRFYEHQPDLNTHNPAVRDEIYKIMGFWLRAGRLGLPHGRGAVPDRAEGRRRRAGEGLRAAARDAAASCSGAAATPSCSPRPTCRRTRACEYFGDEGDRLQMMLNFPVNQRLFYALATGDIEPLAWALEQTPQTAARRRSGCSSCAATTSSTSAGSPTSSAQRCSTAFAPDKSHAALRPRHPPPAGADARQRPAAAGARVQPAVLAARHADDAVRRRDRHGRRPVAARARVRAHADAVDGRAARRLLAGGADRAARSSTTAIYGYEKVNVPTSGATRTRCSTGRSGASACARNAPRSAGASARCWSRGTRCWCCATLPRRVHAHAAQLQSRRQTVRSTPGRHGGLLVDVFDENHSRARAARTRSRSGLRPPLVPRRRKRQRAEPDVLLRDGLPFGRLSSRLSGAERGRVAVPCVFRLPRALPMRDVTRTDS